MLLKNFSRLLTTQYIRFGLQQPQNIFKKNLFKVSLVTGFTFMYSKNIFLNDFYEAVVDDNFVEGEKRAVQVGPKEDDSVLVVKYKDEYYCLSNACCHYGFPLSKGTLIEDKITCPLHFASFSILDGQNDYGPVFNGLEKFDIKRKNGKLIIKVPKSKLNKGRTLQMSRKGNDPRRFVIIGGGPAGLSAAETLRQGGFEGEITILSKENHLTYDRTSLSKNTLGADVKGLQFRSEDFFKNHDINFEKGSEVTAINYDQNFVITQDGKHIHYEGLLIASGGRARVPKLPGVDLKNVFTIREFNDLNLLKQQAPKTKKLVVIGSSFIGLETASSIKSQLKDQVDITVCDFMSAPYESVLGKEVGQAVQKLHEANGIQFRLSTGLKKLEGKNGEVKQVHLNSGEILEADMVILGTGMQPNTKFVGNLNKSNDGGIVTDLYHLTSKPNVWAVGDVAYYPYYFTGQNVRIEHYNEAIYQGYIAAANMLGKRVPNDNIPFFWTRFWNNSLQYVGHAHKFDEVFVDGNMDKQDFIAWYFWNNKVVAAAGMGQGNNEALTNNIVPTADEIKSKSVTVKDLETKVREGNSSRCKCKRAKLLQSK